MMSKSHSLTPTTGHCQEHCVTMCSPWQCVIQLVRDSVEAEATSVAVRIDLGSNDLRFQIIDDGLGLNKKDLESVGKAQWVKVGHERRCRSLTSLRHVTRNLEITSRVKGERTFTVTFTEGRRSQVEESLIMRRSRGVTLSVEGFLWNRRLLCVSVKEVSEIYRVKQGLLALALARPGLRLSLRNDSKGKKEMLLNIGRHWSVAGVFREVFGCLEEGSLVASMKEVDHTVGEVRVSGVMCTEPYHRKRIQFLSANQRPLRRGSLHKDVEKMCTKVETFRGFKSSVKRFPAFALQFSFLSKTSSKSHFPKEDELLDPLLGTIRKFLEDEGLMVKCPESAEQRLAVTSSLLMTGVKPLPSTQCSQSCPSSLLSPNWKYEASPFLFSPQGKGARTSRPVYNRERRRENRETKTERDVWKNDLVNEIIETVVNTDMVNITGNIGVNYVRRDIGSEKRSYIEEHSVKKRNRKTSLMKDIRDIGDITSAVERDNIESVTGRVFSKTALNWEFRGDLEERNDVSVPHHSEEIENGSRNDALEMEIIKDVGNKNVITHDNELYLSNRREITANHCIAMNTESVCERNEDTPVDIDGLCKNDSSNNWIWNDFPDHDLSYQNVFSISNPLSPDIAGLGKSFCWKYTEVLESPLRNKDDQGAYKVLQRKDDQGVEVVLQNKGQGVEVVLQNKDDQCIELELQNRDEQSVEVVLQNKEDQATEVIKQNKNYKDVEVVLQNKVDEGVEVVMQNKEDQGVEVVLQNKDDQSIETVLQSDVPFTEDIGDLSLGSDFTEAKDTTAIISDWTNPHFEVRVSPLKLQTKQDLETECQVTKEGLTKTILLGQVEDKFLATVCGDLLVLWDQHAVHERIRLERLVSQAVEEGQDGKTVVKTAPCHPALTVSLPLCEVPAVLESLLLVERWGLKVVVTSPSSVSLTHIPQTFLEVDLVRQLELCQSLLGELAQVVLDNLTLPQLPHTLLQHIASQACRGAVMFGQCLAQEDCLQLLCDLVQCQAPFQCAHGRPSLAPLVRISSLEQIEGTEKKLNFKNLVT